MDATENKQKKALIAMSGGVDSSVAACLMKEAGFDCIGATMKLFSGEDVRENNSLSPEDVGISKNYSCSSLNDEGISQDHSCSSLNDIGISPNHSCCSLEDVEDARSVARSLGIRYYVFNFAERFQETVIDAFVSAYENGRTPNPCIDCNRYLKFEKLFLRARELFCDYVVTGHYARIERNGTTGRFLLKKALDDTKDQSYVLYALTQEQLAHIQFPLGSLQKTQVRQIAEEHGFINAKKADSQDICFVRNGKYGEFIESYTGRKYPKGDFIDSKGNVLGQHNGIIRYTVGQRKGLGIAFGQPMYVKKIDSAANTVILGTNEELFTAALTAKDINLISVERLDAPMRVKAKVRYRHKEQWATVTQPDEDTLQVVFDEPQRAITAGQAVVLYDGDVVVGGGTIVHIG
ncbi:MAG: tRNA 2-thiouridine(34) synthase MnmA [Lachnospiraceae bacterium]|nr:tRNA 2-thiouridine(34) synthase MnmA [Lachnospiraceae bacterium]